ncbi:hypothetical protein [Erwinia billingiae]|uniref:hypothetical protein n=1 Tax=Erwinia billingiae TaxID=182337 RepID=UPI0022473B31|nr:hypothetical protein [Erwinia billingiae]MCX0498986.1 hypothetical protein [Erwinia billingiae]
MFASMKTPGDFSYAFEKVRNAIASSEKQDRDFAKDFALKILSSKSAQFRQELSDAAELGNHEYDLDTYDHCINVLQQYFDGNPGGLTERDARVYSQYLQTEHDGFAQLAEELASGRG